MILQLFEFGESKKITLQKDLDSTTIDWLRFPLVIAVIFIHSGGLKEIDLDYLHANPFTLESMYDFIRITFSHIGTHFAVPVFFMISGYLFFYKLKEWNLSVYKSKLAKRFKTLFIPYMLWYCICIFMGIIIRTGGVVLKGKPIEYIWSPLIEKGILSIFWDCETWGLNYTNWFGYSVPESSPILVPLWYIRDLMVVILFTPLIYQLIKKFKLYFVSILGLCYLSFVFIPIHGFSACGFFWFSLGAYFSTNNKSMVDSFYRFRIPASILAIVMLIPLIWMNGRSGDGATTTVSTILYPFYVIGAVISSICLASYLLRRKKVGVNKKLVRSTFFIYLLHPFVLLFMVRVNKLSISFNYVWQSIIYLIIPVVTAMICVWLFNLLNKYTPQLLSVLVGNRK